MSIFTGLEEIVETEHPLAGHTWYGLGGCADYFLRPKTVEQLQDVVRRAAEHEINVRVIGFIAAAENMPGSKALKPAMSKSSPRRPATISGWVCIMW